jgi:hypothetical protein
MSGISPISPSGPAGPSQVNPAMQPPSVKPDNGATGNTDFLDGLRDVDGPNKTQQAEPTNPAANDAAAAPERPDNVQETLDRLNGLSKDGVGGANGYDPFNRLETLQTNMQERMELFDDLRGQINRGEADPNDPAVKEVLETRMVDLMLLQSEMNRASFAVELVSKVVEQGTSGAKTILQTQV